MFGCRRGRNVPLWFTVGPVMHSMLDNGKTGPDIYMSLYWYCIGMNGSCFGELGIFVLCNSGRCVYRIYWSLVDRWSMTLDRRSRETITPTLHTHPTLDNPSGLSGPLNTILWTVIKTSVDHCDKPCDLLVYHITYKLSWHNYHIPVNKVTQNYKIILMLNLFSVYYVALEFLLSIFADKNKIDNYYE